ncbi:MAG TPA: glycosyltransferase family 2 protein, partial [Planctomycetota bacterium]|nr:glycosyltransferase family 2 protein [Planctomycetota bacterium]
MARPSVATVVLTWNGREDTLRCLETLRGELAPGDAVVVVDNASSDGTAAAVRAAHPWATLLETGANLGFAGGNNVGLRWALERPFDWIFILNNDTLVPAGTLGALAAFAAAAPAALGAVQPLLVRADRPHVVDSAGQRVCRYPEAEDALMGEPVERAPREAGPIFGACAAAALVRAAALREVGLFDEALFT